MSRVVANEMVKLKKPLHGILGYSDTTWKVTARYTVLLAPRKRVDCVRVRLCSSSSNYMTLHFSVAEFLRLFKPERAAGRDSRGGSR